MLFRSVKVEEYAGMVELVDSVDLGSSVFDVQVRVLSSAPKSGTPGWCTAFSYFLTVSFTLFEYTAFPALSVILQRY